MEVSLIQKQAFHPTHLPKIGFRVSDRSGDLQKHISEDKKNFFLFWPLDSWAQGGVVYSNVTGSWQQILKAVRSDNFRDASTETIQLPRTPRT